MRFTFRTLASIGFFVLQSGLPAKAAEILTGYQPGLTALPLMVVDAEKLFEKHAKNLGIEASSRLVEFGNPGVLNDALLSGRLQFAATAPGSLAILWSRTKAVDQVKAVAALSQMPNFLLTKDPHLKSLRDYADGFKIALPSPKVSIQAVYLEMAAAQQFGREKFDALDRLTIPMRHADGVIAMLSPQTEVTSHFTSPPFQYQELREGKGQVRKILSSYDVLGGKSTFVLLSAQSSFVAKNAQLYSAYADALEEAMQLIKADKPKYAEVYLKYSKSKESLSSVLEMMNDPDVEFSTTPLKLGKVVDFLADIGTIKERTTSWKELTFPNLHTAPGS